ncbi:MAG: TonB-dependent receptor [Pseudomonadota bacterium]
MKIASVQSTSVLALSAALSAMAPSAIAQSNVEDDARPDARRMGVVTVTAQRREENIQEIPVAVSAFSANDLETAQINDTVDLVDTIPNMIGGNNTGLGTASSFFLRGQGQDESFATFDPAVGTYVDEVFVARQNANNFNLFDVERLEVLRGPQGTLFGKNTTGGAVNIIMREPGEEFGGYVEAGYGSFNRIKLRGSVDIPISENARTKFSAFHIKDDGWLKNTSLDDDFNDKDATGLRGALSFDITDTLTWDFVADYVEDSQTNITGELINDDVVSTSLLPGGLEAVFPGAGTEQKSPFGNKTEALNFASDLAWETESGTLNLILGSRNLDQDFLVNFPLPQFASFFPSSPDDVFIIDNLGEHDQLSAELKWTGSYFNDLIDVVAGLYYLDEDNETDVASYFASPNPSRDRVIENTAENVAVYAQFDFNLTDKLTATIGGRYTEEEKNFSVVDNRPLPGGAGGVDGDMTDLTNANMDALGIPREIEENVLTPRFALSYDVSDDLMIYGSATRGFRTGGWNARANTASGLLPFESEFAWSYEAGMRAVFADWWTVNATAFFLEITDLQINTSTGGGTFLIGNAGEMENQGLEIETLLTPTDNLTLFGFLGLQDAEYKPDAEEIAACVAPNAQFGAFDVNCDIADVKRTPDWTLNVGGTYDINLPNGAVIQPRASVRVVPDHITTSRDRGPSGDYTLLNVGIEYTTADERWSATLECTNCGEERYLASTFGNGDIYYNQPGRVEARVVYNFGGK